MTTTYRDSVAQSNARLAVNLRTRAGRFFASGSRAGGVELHSIAAAIEESNASELRRLAAETWQGQRIERQLLDIAADIDAGITTPTTTGASR